MLNNNEQFAAVDLIAGENFSPFVAGTPSETHCISLYKTKKDQGTDMLIDKISLDDVEPISGISFS